MDARNLLLGIAVTVFLVGTAGCGDDDDAAVGVEPPTPACAAPTNDPLDPQSQRHMLPGAPEPAYVTDPPTSGAHQVGNHATGALDSPVPKPVQVALLEEGAIVIQYRRSVPASSVVHLERLAGDDVVVAPADQLLTPIIATAWRHTLRCERVATDAVRDFIDAYQGRGAGGGH